MIRRQQEAKHLELKEEFIQVTTKVEELIAEIQLTKAATLVQQNELTASYTKTELLADSIARVSQRVTDLEDDHLTHLEF